MLRDEAQVSTAGLHFRSFGLELVPGQVEVDLLAAEFEGVAFVEEEANKYQRFVRIRVSLFSAEC